MGVGCGGVVGSARGLDLVGPLMSRIHPWECAHGVIMDWGSFGPGPLPGCTQCDTERQEREQLIRQASLDAIAAAVADCDRRSLTADEIAYMALAALANAGLTTRFATPEQHP